jgi:crotonobetainyl-CoA:carnitine CoA-transferase CaiB-like acyl-CoA transferase
MLQSDRDWPGLCRHLDRPDLIEDPRFVDSKKRLENNTACVAELEAIFASRPLAEWKEKFATLEGVWAPMQTARELPDDPQVIANGYLPELESAAGTKFSLVASPVQFDEEPPVLTPAPELGQHTEEILLDLGLGWEDIGRYKDSGAIG